MLERTGGLSVTKGTSVDLPRLSTKTDDKILDENTAKRAETHAVHGESGFVADLHNFV